MMKSQGMKSQGISTLIYLTAGGIGILSLFYPFLLPAVTANTPLGQARMAETPILIILLLGFCLLVLLFEAQGRTMDTRLIALLGILVAFNSALRFIEVAIPGPGGFSPIFFLIILTGYIFGPNFGFLMGALTLFVSALITGGVGPWLPSQMFVAGWVGMSAPLCRPLARALKLKGRPAEVFLLVGFGALWGFLFGLCMNLWSWPFIVGPEQLYWSPGTGAGETLQRYLAYYVVTSLVWDLMAALGNVLLILAFGGPVLRALRRFQVKFTFYVTA